MCRIMTVYKKQADAEQAKLSTEVHEAVLP